ncbi:MAG: rhizobiocin secretion protein [Hyphomicrobiales bacterium]|nr:rhizobiocin secretion protein [Hyphomicrobiales bacterium]
MSIRRVAALMTILLSAVLVVGMEELVGPLVKAASAQVDLFGGSSMPVGALVAGSAVLLTGWLRSHRTERGPVVAEDMREEPDPVRRALALCRQPLAVVAMFSGVVNILALTGSIYMLQVYDRVITSRSVPTLVGLTMLMVGLYLVNGLLEVLRTRITMRVGARFDRAMRGSVFGAMMQLPLRQVEPVESAQAVRDLEQVRAFVAGPGPISLFDMPWMPVYLGLVYLLHPVLGLVATAGAVLLVFLTILTEVFSRAPARAAATSAMRLNALTEASRRNAEVICALGMLGDFRRRFEMLSAANLADQLRAQDVTTQLGSITKVFRMVLQSGMLGLGAYLTISGEATGGIMIAASILTSRALAPVEIAIANWRTFVSARQSYARLKLLVKIGGVRKATLELPAPVANLKLENVSLAPPGHTVASVRNISLTLEAGQGLGIIGPSASGKSTLARGIVGLWRPLGQGSVRLDAASLDQWPDHLLGRHIGYLPQDIELFEGTIAENIARFRPDASMADVIAAAQDAGVHELILHLDKGYETDIRSGGQPLSAGQRQRIALARALFGNPFLVVLDEPNSNLDSDGEEALTRAIASVRARGGIVVVIAHRPSALAAVDMVMVLAKGQAQAFGPKEQVLKSMTVAVQPRQDDRPARTPSAGDTRPREAALS